MEELELIRATVEIDRQLAEIARAVSDERLKGDVLGFQARWREVSYLVTADICGVASGAAPEPPRRRRRRKLQDERPSGEHDEAAEETRDRSAGAH